MADIQIEDITPSAMDATDQVMVRRGAGPLDHTIALVDFATAVATNLSYDAATRTVGSDTGTDAVLTLADISNPGLARVPDRGPDRFVAFTDMVSLSTNAEISTGQSGTGAGLTVITNQDGGTGWLGVNLGTVANSRVNIGSNGYGMLLFGLGAARFKARIRVPVLSDATTRYTFRAGFLDSVTGESVDGAFFRYTDTVAGGNFQCVTRDNNTETAVDSGITVAISTTYILEIVVNAAGTEALFYINDVLVATITTNIPITAGREFGYGLHVNRSVGTAATTPLHYDYLFVEQLFSGR